MQYFSENGNIVLAAQDSFSLHDIFDCGQTFRWNQNDDQSFTGVAADRALTVSQKDGKIIFHGICRDEFENFWADYFDFKTDYSKIKSALGADPILKEAIKYGSGIRILKQDLWECVVSFIISASNNIPRIKKIIELLCENFGERFTYMGKEFYSFPAPEKIAALTPEDLSVIRSGFRDKYILDAAKKFKSGEISQQKFAGLSADDAKEMLMTIKGVGNKVANCIMLFGLSHCECFPVDVWIKRIMEYLYFDAPQTPARISLFAQEKFGALGGYAQQYLFFYARENKIGL